MIPFGVEVSKLQIINKEQAFQTFQRFCSVKPGAVRKERARTAPCWKLPAATRLGPTRTLLQRSASAQSLPGVRASTANISVFIKLSLGDLASHIVLTSCKSLRDRR